MGWEPIALNNGVTLHHDIVDGLSTYWVEGGGPFRAVLVFRVGQADETLPTRGICHLVEHLAIEPQPRLYPHNGWCSIDATGFWAEGDRDCQGLRRPVGELRVPRRQERAGLARAPDHDPPRPAAAGRPRR